jgi:hypothetical protein
VEVAQLANLVMNALTAGLVAYTARALQNLRRGLNEAKRELHEDMAYTRRENGL